MKAFTHIFYDAEKAAPSLRALRTTIIGVILVLRSLSQLSLSSRTVVSCQLPHIYVETLDVLVRILKHCATADRVRHNLIRRRKDIHPISNEA
jgi:hypothetical protein